MLETSLEKAIRRAELLITDNIVINIRPMQQYEWVLPVDELWLMTMRGKE